MHERQIKGIPGVSRRNGGITLFRRNRRFTAVALSFSGERFQGLGGTIGSGTKGEMERRVSALYRRRESSKRQGLIRN
jgi:hypothetical protein